MLVNDDASKVNIQSIIAQSSLRGIGLACTNLGLATLFILFAIANARNFIANPRLSVFLIVVTEAIVAFFLLVRRDADETRHTWQAWVTTVCGTFAPLLLRPIDATQDLLPGEILQVIAFTMQIAALLYLNRSIGLLPAHRGVKCSGLYGCLRHPLYTAYVITFLGYWINNQSPHNAVVALAGTTFLVMRIHHEEALLEKYGEYRSYTDRVRWRLIPYVW
jgi:protein-S-isoprenylcysteine O-methyltransferase Ste14